MASVLDLKSKEEKDAELDRKIEALRKKNEALVRRHQLIEEDRKMAEQEGIAVTTPRKGKHPEGEPDKARKEKENFSITVDIGAGEKWVVNDRKSPKPSHHSPHNDTSPKSPTNRGSSRTSQFSSGRSHHREGSEDDEDAHPSEKPLRGRRNQGNDGPRRGGRGAGDASSGERWSSSPRGGSTPMERGGRVTTPGERGGRGLRSRLGERGGRGGGTPGRGGGPGGEVDGIVGGDRKVKEWEEKRRMNIEMMNEEMEKIAEYERSQRDGVRDRNPIRNFLDDPRRSGPSVEVDRKEGSRRHNRNWGGMDFEKVKTGMDRDKETHVRRPGPRNQVDMTMSMTGRERAEYVRWKKEREQIDQERLARHRKPTGQWKREWDAEKTDTMFKNDDTPHVEEEPASRRDKGKRGAPKPPTMSEFLPDTLTDSGRKRDHNRGRVRSKPYSMHDSRWEEPEEPQQKEETVGGEEKETCVEKVEERKVEAPQKAPKTEQVEDDTEDIEDEEEEWEDASDDEEEMVGSSTEDHNIAEAEHPITSPVTPQPPSKEQRPPRQTETPKLTMPPQTPDSGEKSEESNPTTPFSPDGYHPVSDWGEEMEMLSPRASSNEDSPPQLTNKEGNSAMRPLEDSSPTGSFLFGSRHQANF
ncbi:coiled-coil domain-containing protein 9 isoform 2-T2 [Discoglossus pictus]